MKKIHQVAEDVRRVTLLQSKEVSHTYQCRGLILQKGYLLYFTYNYIFLPIIQPITSSLDVSFSADSAKFAP